MSDRRVAALSDTWTDFGHAWRLLRRAPKFTALAAGTLGLALGALAAIFSVVDAVLLRPLPYADPDRLIYIVGSAPGSDLPAEFGESPEFYLQFREATLLEDAALYSSGTNTLRVGDQAERIPMARHSWDLFRTLGVTPILGRLPLPEDDDDVAVISHWLWTTWFASDPQVIGRAYAIAGETRTVIGVMGEPFWFPDDEVHVWFPYPPSFEGILGTGAFGMGLVGRMRPGASEVVLVQELDQLALRIPDRFGGQPSNAFDLQRHRTVVRPLKAQLFDGAGPLWILLGCAAITLLVACANVASLFMVRAESRLREQAVLRALGGTRARLIRIGLAEALGVALLAGALATLVAQAGVPMFVQASPDPEGLLSEARLSVATLVFTFAGAVVSGLLCGLVPAVRASAPRLSSLRSGRGTTRGSHLAQNCLIAAQTALALVLLIGSALLVRSFTELRRVDPGYETQDLVTFQFAPELPALVDGPSYAQFHMDFMDRIAALPGVESVGVVNNVPLDEGVNPGQFESEEGANEPNGGTLVSYTYSGGDYFATMGIEIELGRDFARTDHISDLGNVVISRAAAELLWPGQNPIGRRMRRVDGDDWHTVVGVAENTLQSDLSDSPVALVYFPMVGPGPDSWSVTTPGYVVKTSRAAFIMPEIRELIRQVAPGAPVYAVYTMEELASRELAVLRFTMFLLGMASALALILGAVGLFGVLSYMVASRTKEIGIRVALGAQVAQVQRLFVGRGARVVGIGVAIGLGLAFLSTRALGALLFGVAPADVVTFGAMALAMMGVGLLASYLPAKHASSVSPMEALRSI